MASRGLCSLQAPSDGYWCVLQGDEGTRSEDLDLLEATLGKTIERVSG